MQELATASSRAAGAIPSKADRVREFEVFRYYNPDTPGRDTDDIPSQENPPKDNANALVEEQASSPDAILTALAQLCAIRLNASRAMISLVGRETQYFIAESTKTLTIGNTHLSDQEGDELWFGCGNVDKKGRLCERTIELRPLPDGSYPCFIVPDLTLDERFNQLPFVTGPPFFKFYAGSPLTTHDGISLGSLFIIDDKTRPGLSTKQQAFLSTIAQTVMKNLEMNREAQEKKRVVRLSSGLSAFVEGKARLKPKQQTTAQPAVITSVGSPARSPQKSNAPERSNSDRGLSGIPSHLQLSKVTSDSTLTGDRDSSQDDSDMELPQRNKDVGHYETFSRAANLLREALNLTSGGVVFYDAATGFQQQDREPSLSDLLDLDGGHRKAMAESMAESGSLSPSTPSASPTFISRTFDSSMRKQDRPNSAQILGFSTANRPFNSGLNMKLDNTDTLVPLGESELETLLRKYPRGKMWTHDEFGNLSSSEEDHESAPESGKTTTVKSSRTERKRRQARLLQKHFPGFRQLLFMPLWDSGLGRWFSGCFCWATTMRHSFSSEIELSFLTAFASSVMSEVSKLATIAADQQKGDFIGSISHELRSPLHGILASAEFLSDTICDSFQQSLIGTIESCGRTLLDTINHVLDFSKINSFERSWGKSQKHKNDHRNSKSGSSRGKAATIKPLSSDAPPLLNIYATTDAGLLCEEVIEGVFFGQNFSDIRSSDISDISSKPKGRPSERGTVSANHPSLSGNSAQRKEKAVEVVLDIEPGDYTFTTQPGALRRVIMNLFGNSVKYTQKGLIVVKLQLHDLDVEDEEERAKGKNLVIKITDTGQGISSDYLRTRLFTPFSQENSISPGTGLGLSLVRSIVDMLGGSIEIRSQVGQGTEVVVCLPLLRVPEKGELLSTPSTATSLDRSEDGPIAILREQANGKSVALYGFDGSPGEDFNKPTILRKTLEQYISSWFGFNFIPTWSLSAHADVIIADEKDLPKLVDENVMNSSIIAFCGSAAGGDRYKAQLGKVEYLSKPIGPYRLARALRMCLEKSKKRNGLTPPTTPFSENKTPTAEFEELTINGEDEHTPLLVQTNGVVTATVDSENAQKALGASSMSNMQDESAEDKHSGPDFPFPKQDLLNVMPSPIKRKPQRPGIHERATEPLSKDSSHTKPTVTEPPSIVQKKVREDTPAPDSTTTKRQPKVLLVDDNAINLRLLQTFIKIRKYTFVDSAENGQLAVDAAMAREDGYDIIFMDISMPVLDGFQATRAIRDLEASRRSLAGPDAETASPALVIALTGLASSRDQSEAFACGVDLFMTKPVSFKEVGRLLDNWEANGSG